MTATARTVPVLVVLAALLLAPGPASADTTRTFANPAPIAVPASGSVGAGLPYPSSIEVRGMTGPIRAARLTLNGFGHERPIDVGVLLVPLSGRSTMIMQRRCGFTPVEDRTWTFTAFELNPEMPLDGPCDGSVYRPGSSGQGSFRLPRPTRRRLAQLRKVRMRGTVTARDALGNATTARFRFPLKAPASRKRRAR